MLRLYERMFSLRPRPIATAAGMNIRSHARRFSFNPDISGNERPDF